MLRINGSRETGQLYLEGRLADEWVDELERIAGDTSKAGLLVDLSAVAFVDQRGVALLQDLAGAGATLIGASTFVRSLLRGVHHESRH